MSSVEPKPQVSRGFSSVRNACRSEAITKDVRVEVESEYAPSRSRPLHNEWFFHYTVRITNEGDDTVQLLSRHWIVTDGNGATEEIKGLGVIGEQPVLLLGHQKGRDTRENVARNFGMASPGGYRKAMRLMEHADRFRLPILSFIDTPGAYAGLLAEEQGQGEAIAVNLREMFRLRVPILATVIGEGGSGGALGIGVADRLLMFQHSVYTVASPEACASILWRDAAKAPVAAEALKITAPDLQKLGIIDVVIPEPSGGNHWAPRQAAEALKAALQQQLAELLALPEADLLSQRYSKFRRMGRFLEAGAQDASLSS